MAKICKMYDKLLSILLCYHLFPEMAHKKCQHCLRLKALSTSFDTNIINTCNISIWPHTLCSPDNIRQLCSHPWKTRALVNRTSLHKPLTKLLKHLKIINYKYISIKPMHILRNKSRSTMATIIHK